jgi:hypothetical protein
MTNSSSFRTLLAIVFASSVVLLFALKFWLGAKEQGRVSVHDLSKPAATLANPGFEQGTSAWKFYFDESDGKVIKDDGVMGTSCVRLLVSPHHQLDGFSQVIDPIDSKVLRLTGSVAAKGADIRAYLLIECMNANTDPGVAPYGQLAVSKSGTCPLSGEWTEISTSITIPPETTHIRVFACVEGTAGHAQFDNFSIDRQN